MRRVVTVDDAEGDLGSKDLNARVAAKARELLETGESGIHEIGGRSIFFDVLVPPPQLVVLGAGDDARPLVRFAADVGFRVVVVDRRPGYLTRERFPGAAALVESAGDELDAVLPLDAECYAVVMNHNFADDQAYVRDRKSTRLNSSHGYISYAVFCLKKKKKKKERVSDEKTRFSCDE